MINNFYCERSPVNKNKNKKNVIRNLHTKHKSQIKINCKMLMKQNPIFCNNSTNCNKICYNVQTSKNKKNLTMHLIAIRIIFPILLLHFF